MGPSVIAMLPEVRLNTLILGQHAPIPLPRPRLFGYRIARSALPRERFSPLAGRSPVHAAARRHDPAGTVAPAARAAPAGTRGRAFRTVLLLCMRARYATIAVTIALFALAAVGSRFVQQQLFPASDRPAGGRSFIAAKRDDHGDRSRGRDLGKAPCG